jgi:hypothetical protein
VVWVYGSLVKPGRFHSWSDVDVALESLPAGMTLEYLQSLLSADVGREVDVPHRPHPPEARDRRARRTMDRIALQILEDG